MNDSNQIIIKRATIVDTRAITEVSRLHREGIPEGFLSSLGVSFLTLLYQAMAQSENAVLFFALHNGRVAGYISGCTRVKEFFQEFRKKNFFRALSLVVLKVMFCPSVLRKISETSRYPAKSSYLPPAELLSIVVATEYRGTGLAEQLFKYFCSELKSRGEGFCKVLVSSRNERANSYYRKVGFKLLDSFEVHQGEKSNIYVKALNGKQIENCKQEA